MTHGATFKREEAATYDAAAASFARLSRTQTRDIARHVVALASLTAGEAVLDVGTGTGIVALEAAAAVAPGGRVVGIDVSAAMLALARAQAEESGLLGSAEFRVMDAERLLLADRSFDAAVSLFALLHFPDPRRALAEMFRVLRPGGRLVVAVGSAAPRSVAGLLHAVGRLPELVRERAGRRLVAPRFLERLVAERLPDAGRSWDDHSAHNRPRDLPAAVREAGFTALTTTWIARESAISTPEEFWEIQRTFSSAVRRRLDGAPAETVEALRGETVARASRVLARGGSLAYPRAALVVSARRP